MATVRTFAYNSGTGVTGTTQVGYIAAGATAANYGSGLTWWKGPDEDLGYVICHTSGARTAGQNSYAVASPTIGFWRSPAKTDNSFVAFCNSVFKQNFENATDATVWLTLNGYWSSYSSSVTLVMNLDSTTGVTGSNWTDISGGGHSATLNGGYGTTTYNGNQVVTLNGTSGYVLPSNFGTQLNSTGFTYNVWVYPTTASNGTVIAEWGGTPPNGWTDAQIALVSGTIRGGVFSPSDFSPTGYITGPSFSANTWYNIAMTYNSTTKDLKLYINGTLNSTVNGTKSNPGTLYLSLGRPDGPNNYLGGASGYFQGYVGSWKMWNGPISATNILSNYNLTKSIYGL